MFPCLPNNTTYQYRPILTCNNTWALRPWFRVPRPMRAYRRPLCKRRPSRISPVKDKFDHRIHVYVLDALIRPLLIQNGRMNIAVMNASLAIVGKWHNFLLLNWQVLFVNFYVGENNFFFNILLKLSKFSITLPVFFFIYALTFPRTFFPLVLGWLSLHKAWVFPCIFLFKLHRTGSLGWNKITPNSYHI